MSCYYVEKRESVTAAKLRRIFRKERRIFDAAWELAQHKAGFEFESGYKPSCETWTLLASKHDIAAISPKQKDFVPDKSVWEVYTSFGTKVYYAPKEDNSLGYDIAQLFKFRLFDQQTRWEIAKVLRIDPMNEMEYNDIIYGESGLTEFEVWNGYVYFRTNGLATKHNKDVLRVNSGFYGDDMQWQRCLELDNDGDFTETDFSY